MITAFDFLPPPSGIVGCHTTVLDAPWTALGRKGFFECATAAHREGLQYFSLRNGQANVIAAEADCFGTNNLDAVRAAGPSDACHGSADLYGHNLGGPGADYIYRTAENRGVLDLPPAWDARVTMVGCFKDRNKAKLVDLSPKSIDGCAAAAADGKYTYFSVQSPDRCYVNNDLAVITSAGVDDTCDLYDMRSVAQPGALTTYTLR